MKGKQFLVAALACSLLAQIEVSGSTGLISHLGGVEWHAEALYWRPLHCTIQWADNREDLPSGQALSTSFGYDGTYDWGFQVGADYRGECRRYGISYLWYRSSSSRFQEALGPVGLLQGLLLIGSFDSAFSGDADFYWRYQTVVGEIGFPLVNTCSAQLDLLAQVRWTRLDMHFTITGPDGLDAALLLFQSYGSKFDAGGLGLALDGFRELFCHLSFYGQLGMNALIGQHHRRHLVILGVLAGDNEVGHPYRYTAIVPQLELDLGLRWHFCCPYVTLGARVGYALDFFLDGLRFPIVSSLVDDLPISPPEDIGFAGPYFGLEASF